MINQPLIVAHRGAMGEAPENTIGAFKLALEQGATAFELDVHLSADGEIVVIHDHSLNRTTNGTGAIDRLTVAQLKQLDAGSWFNEKYKGEQIPLLNEVFDLVPESFVINIEIKDHGGHKIEPKLIELLKRKGRMESVVVSSFDHKCLFHLKQLARDIKVGLLYNSDFVSHLGVVRAAQMQVYSIHPYFKAISTKDIHELIENGYQVYAWTVNSEADLTSVLQSGVQGIITNFPGRLKQIMGEI